MNGDGCFEILYPFGAELLCLISLNLWIKGIQDFVSQYPHFCYLSGHIWYDPIYRHVVSMRFYIQTIDWLSMGIDSMLLGCMSWLGQGRDYVSPVLSICICCNLIFLCHSFCIDCHGWTCYAIIQLAWIFEFLGTPNYFGFRVYFHVISIPPYSLSPFHHTHFDRLPRTCLFSSHKHKHNINGEIHKKGQ